MNNYEIQRWENGKNGNWMTQEAGEAKSRRAFIKKTGYKQKKGTQTRVVKT